MPRTAEEPGGRRRALVVAYRTGVNVNRVWSDLAVAGESAWVSDPAAGLIHKIDY